MNLLEWPLGSLKNTCSSDVKIREGFYFKRGRLIMLRRNFMSMLGLGGIVECGIGSLLGRSVEKIDLNKIHRVEDKEDACPCRVRYLKFAERKNKPHFFCDNLTLIEGKLSDDYILVLHNPDGPASICRNETATNYNWILNGEPSVSGPNGPNSINVSKRGLYIAHFNWFWNMGPDSRIVAFDSERNKISYQYPKSRYEKSSDQDCTKEQFEAEIGMTIEKLLSFN